MSQTPSNAFWVDEIYVGGTGIPGSVAENVTLNGENAKDAFGWSVSGGGNVNGDAFDDVVVGAPTYGAWSGRAYVFFGNGSMPSRISASDANVTMNGPNPGDRFGYSVAGADLGSDGYSDILVGAPYNDTIDGSRSDAGAVYVFNGSVSISSVLDTGNMTRYGETASDHFGWSVFGAVDVNDDNSGDLIVGAPHYDSGAESDAGKAYVLTIIPEFPQVVVPILLLILIVSRKRRHTRS